MIPQASAPHQSGSGARSAEFELSDADFRELARLIREKTGIALSDSKRNLVYARLARRLRILGLSSFAAYRKRLESPEGSDEIEHFINAISTNLTQFFREAHHFDSLREHVAIPFAASCAEKKRQRLRIWSAGCSTGEEAYSIALVIDREVSNEAGADIRILATDIDTDVLAKARRGEYPLESVAAAPVPYRDLIKRGAAISDRVVVNERLRSLVAFKRLNLMDAWPMSGLFDAIFCRNVMIYFDGPTKSALVERLIVQLKPGGWLYVGHSESLVGAHANLQLIGRTAYRRVA